MLNRRKFFGLMAAAPVAATMPAPASGGMVRPDRWYTIGERGRETIVTLPKLETNKLAKALRRIEANLRADIVRLHTPDAAQTFNDGDGI